MKAALLVALASMTAQAADVAGHYVLHMREVGSELMLKPDGTFEYMLAYGAADYWAKGAWKRDHETVVLSSAGKKAEPFRLLRSTADGTDGIRIWITAPNGNPVPNIDVGVRMVQGAIGGRTSDKGVVELPSAREPVAVSFRIAVYGLETKPMEVNSSHHDFYFEINGDAITEVHFEGERLAVEGKVLMLRYFDKDEPMRYEKQ